MIRGCLVRVKGDYARTLNRCYVGTYVAAPNKCTYGVAVLTTLLLPSFLASSACMAVRQGHARPLARQTPGPWTQSTSPPTACKGHIRAVNGGAFCIMLHSPLTACERHSAEALLSFTPAPSKISTTPHTVTKQPFSWKKHKHSIVRGAVPFPAAEAGMASAADLVIAFIAQRAPQP